MREGSQPASSIIITETVCLSTGLRHNPFYTSHFLYSYYLNRGFFKRSRVTHLIKHPVEQTGHYREDGWPQGLQVVHQQPNVPLKVADPSPVDEDDSLVIETKDSEQ